MYRITGELSRTGVSVVYLAEDVLLRRRVVVKSLREPLARDERFRRRFRCECRLAASLEHPHVVPVYAAGEAGGAPFLVMPYLRGGDLQTLLHQRGPLPLPRAVSIVTQIAAALDHLHASGLVHRDVKPANILLDAGHNLDRAYLSDFGITAGCPCPALPAAVPLGSAGFAAPEQLAGHRPDPRADVYSLGRILEACVDPVPFATSQVIARAVAEAPGDRYRTCGELAEALHRTSAVLAA